MANVHTSKYQRQRLLYMDTLSPPPHPFVVYTYFIYSKSKSQQCIQLKSGIEKWLTGSLHVLPGGGSWGAEGVAGAVTVAARTMGLGYILIFDHNNLLSRPTDDHDDDGGDNDKVSTI